MKVILVGGTPGTGKTTIVEKLATKLGRDIVHLGELALERNCITQHDGERDTDIINEDCLVDAIQEIIEDSSEDLIIEGHFIDLVPGEFVEQVIVLRAHPDDISLRLEERNYRIEKIKENVEAEVFGVCQLDALDAFSEDKVYEVNTSELSPDETVDIINNIITSGIKPTRIDWMELLEEEGTLEDYLQD